jgi:hypothetical protein
MVVVVVEAGSTLCYADLRQAKFAYCGLISSSSLSLILFQQPIKNNACYKRGQN